MLRFVFAMVFVTGCVTSEKGLDEPRGQLGEAGKADNAGSCSTAESCGGKAENGNCWCDEQCAGHGDCCEDKAAVCPGGTLFATYNAGLAHGAVPFAAERIPAIIEELKASTADVMCLQEVWTDEDGEAIRAGIEETFPHSIRQKTENDSNDWFACGVTQWTKLFAMNSCVAKKCTPSGISAFECAADQCAPEWGAMSETCKLCLAANTTSPLKCAAWRAPMYGNDGRNGLMLVSREELKEAKYTAFDTAVIKRGVLSAETSGYNVQCTHMTADLAVVPYPSDRKFKSWREEHHAQVKVMADLAGDRKRTVMFGDLNTGPASTGVDGELPENYDQLLAAGYIDTWTEEQVCTYCQDNPLVCSKPGGCAGGLNSRLDHILLKNFAPDVSLEFSRFGDQEITIKDSAGVSHKSRPSDHYGVIATMPF